MRLSLSIFLLMMAINASPVIANQKPLVSWLIYPDQPNGPGFEVWPVESQANHFVWRLLSSDRKVLAEMNQPELRPGQRFNYGQCKLSGQLRNDVIAVVKHSKTKEWSANFLKIWIADPSAKRFIPDKPENAVCLNEDWGV